MYGIIGLQKLLNTNAYQQVSQRVITCKLMPYIINMLGQLQYPPMQCYAIKVLSHLSYGNDKQCLAIVNCGGVSFIMEIINDIKTEQSLIDVVRIFGNLAAQGANYRDRLIYSNAIEKLIGVVRLWNDISESIKSIQETASWALSNICRGSPLPQYDMVKQGIAFLLQMLINDKITHDKNSLQSTLWALSFHSEYFKSISSPSQIFTLLQKIGQIIISKSSEKQIIVPSIKILQKLIEFHRQASQKFVLNVGIKFINKNLKITSKNIRLDTIILVSVILKRYANNEQVINKLVNKSFVELLMQVFDNDPVDSKTIICEILQQMVESSQKLNILKLFHELSIIKHLIKSSKFYHKHLVMVVLKCLFKLLQISEQMADETKGNLLMDDFINQKGTQIVEALQLHPDQQIFKKALQLLERFFQTQEQQV